MEQNQDFLCRLVINAEKPSLLQWRCSPDVEHISQLLHSVLEVAAWADQLGQCLCLPVCCGCAHVAPPVSLMDRAWPASHVMHPFTRSARRWPVTALGVHP